jgi:hypothetical protein
VRATQGHRRRGLRVGDDDSRFCKGWNGGPAGLAAIEEVDVTAECGSRARR